MFKIWVLTLLLFSMGVSSLGHSLELIANKKTACSALAQPIPAKDFTKGPSNDCSDANENTSPSDAEKTHHCLSCQHIPFIDLVSVVLVAFSLDSEVVIAYTFFYKNPTTESLERPPLTA